MPPLKDFSRSFGSGFFICRLGDPLPPAEKQFVCFLRIFHKKVIP
jgi:hypothetical protein